MFLKSLWILICPVNVKPLCSDTLIIQPQTYVQAHTHTHTSTHTHTHTHIHKYTHTHTHIHTHTHSHTGTYCSTIIYKKSWFLTLPPEKNVLRKNQVPCNITVSLLNHAGSKAHPHEQNSHIQKTSYLIGVIEYSNSKFKIPWPIVNFLY